MYGVSGVTAMSRRCVFSAGRRRVEAASLGPELASVGQSGSVIQDGPSDPEATVQVPSPTRRLAGPGLDSASPSQVH